MPTPTFSRLDPAASREVTADVAREVQKARAQPKITNLQFGIALLVMAAVFAVVAYLLFW